MNAVVLALCTWFGMMFFFLFLNTFDIFNGAQILLLWVIGIVVSLLTAVVVFDDDFRPRVQEYLDSLGRKDE